MAREEGQGRSLECPGSHVSQEDSADVDKRLEGDGSTSPGARGTDTDSVKQVRPVADR